MIYVDEFGIEWLIDTDGTLILADIPRWPQADNLFLKLCGIRPFYEEVNEN